MNQDRLLVVLVPGWPPQDAEGLEPVIKNLIDFTPGVSLINPGRIALLTLGPSRYFGGENSLAEKVKTSVSKIVKRPVNVGIADGLFAATLAAKQNRNILKGKNPEFLYTMPVGVLPNSEVAGLLMKLGIKTLGLFAKLDRKAVLERLGTGGMWCHMLACGNDPTLITTNSSDELAKYLEIDPPIEDFDRVTFLAKQLGNELIETLEMKGLCTTTIELELGFEDGSTSKKLWHNELPFTALDIADRTRWQLNFIQPVSSLSSININVISSCVTGLFQDSLFTSFNSKSQAIEKALKKVEGIIGGNAIKIPSYLPSRNLEDSIQFKRFGETHNLENMDFPWPGKLPAPLPAAYYHNPTVIKVLDENGEKVLITSRALCKNTPSTVSIKNGPLFKVKDWCGPWPREERWWDIERWKRKLLIQVLLENEMVCLLSLFKEEWHLEAIYD